MADFERWKNIYYELMKLIWKQWLILNIGKYHNNSWNSNVKTMADLEQWNNSWNSLWKLADLEQWNNTWNSLWKQFVKTMADFEKYKISATIHETVMWKQWLIYNSETIHETVMRKQWLILNSGEYLYNS